MALFFGPILMIFVSECSRNYFENQKVLVRKKTVFNTAEVRKMTYSLRRLRVGCCLAQFLDGAERRSSAVRSRALEMMGLMLQHNPDVQQACLDAGGLQVRHVGGGRGVRVLIARNSLLVFWRARARLHRRRFFNFNE